MNLIITDAIVLHMRDYLESSRILRLATREIGIQSVLARGARSSRKRFGSAVDLFAEGQAQIQMKPGRELNTLVSLDIVEGRAPLAQNIERFVAASALAEFSLRLINEEVAPLLYDGVRNGLHEISSADVSGVGESALAAMWRLVAEAGFTPSLVSCAECHALVPAGSAAAFSTRAGGVLCERCSFGFPRGRRLPASERARIAGWIGDLAPDSGYDHPTTVSPDLPALRAHQRLLREFLAEHVPDRRPLVAYAVWENDGWAGAPT